MSADNLREALVDEIKDLYNAEKQLLKALPKMARGAESDQLRDAFQSHLEETEGQVARLEQVFEMLDEKPRGRHCAGMAGILEEGNEKLQDDLEGAVLDAVLIASAQKVEHYEIGAYGTAIAWAKALGLDEVSETLNEILEEEKAADQQLSSLAEAGINQMATRGEVEWPKTTWKKKRTKKRLRPGRRHAASRSSPRRRRNPRERAGEGDNGRHREPGAVSSRFPVSDIVLYGRRQTVALAVAADQEPGLNEFAEQLFGAGGGQLP